MKLFKVKIETYIFGMVKYTNFVYAKNEEEARQIIYQQECYRKDEDAEICEITEIDLADRTPRVL